MSRLVPTIFFTASPSTRESDITITKHSLPCSQPILTDKVSGMVRQTVFGFKLERTEEALTAHGWLALLAEFHHGLGL